ncbi:MAG: hypothetical protein H6625_04570, partial [Bdellovibrionaceae bacterium]|nr:hypothetical protein [Pseudobdellovibrionaceae bacterium]
MKGFGINKIIEETKEDMVILTYTSFLPNKKGDEWEALKFEYSNCKDPVHGAVTSILNSVLTQKRVYFCLTRKGLRNLIKEDKNNKKSGFS